jgi:hypothetical protein
MDNRSIPANAAVVTPSDTASQHGLGLYVGGAGNVSLEMAGGGNITLIGCVAGTLLPVEFARVRLTSTTATNLVRFW